MKQRNLMFRKHETNFVWWQVQWISTILFTILTRNHESNLYYAQKIDKHQQFLSLMWRKPWEYHENSENTMYFLSNPKYKCLSNMSLMIFPNKHQENTNEFPLILTNCNPYNEIELSTYVNQLDNTKFSPLNPMAMIIWSNGSHLMLKHKINFGGKCHFQDTPLVPL